MNYVSLNGKLLPEQEPVLLAANRGYRYGDGLFETMKMINGKIMLSEYHFERLFAGLVLLQFEIPKFFTAEKIQEHVLALCKKNSCEHLARIRLSVFRGNGGLYDENKTLEYLVECWPLNESVNSLNENGLAIGVYTDARKSCDRFSNLKSANFLIYAMAALYAKENKWNDSLLLNTNNRICDSTIANLFWIKDEKIFTPPLSEGCVNGVMRRYLVNELPGAGYTIEQNTASIADLENADEIFLTNAINGIRWVREFRGNTYPNTKVTAIHQRFSTILLP